MKIADLFAELGFKITGKDKLDDAKDGLKQAEGAAAKTAIGLAAVNAAFLLIMDTAARAGQMLQNFASTTGLSTEELQKWQHLAEANGVSANEMAGAIKNLQTQATNFKLGDPSTMGVWGLLGVDPTQDPFKVVKDLRAKVAELKDPGIARNLLGRVGLEGIMPVLRASNAEFEKWSQAFVLNDKQVESLSRLNGAWSSLKQSVASVKNQFAVVFAPAMEVVAKVLERVAERAARFFRWLSSGGAVAKTFRGFLIAVAAAVALLTVAVGAMAIAFGIASAATIALEIAALPLTGTIGLLLVGIGALIVAIPAVVLLLEDFWGALTGKKSMLLDTKFGAWLAKWSEAARILQVVAMTVRILRKEFEGLSDSLSAFAKSSGKGNVVLGMLGLGGLVDKAAPPSVSNSSSSVHQENNVDIHVSGSDRPRETASDVYTTFKQQIDNSSYGLMPAASN